MPLKKGKRQKWWHIVSVVQNWNLLKGVHRVHACTYLSGFMDYQCMSMNSLVDAMLCKLSLALVSWRVPPSQRSQMF